MKLSIKDLIKIGIVAVLSFPLLYVVMLFASGTLRLEYVTEDEKKGDIEKLEMMKQSTRTDSLSELHMESLQALKREKKEIEEKNHVVQQKIERLESVKSELEEERKKIAEQRKLLENVAKESGEEDKKRMKQLARIYGAMRTNEAARILETLEDGLVVRIFRNINDDRQRSGILAAMSGEKAKRISRMLSR